jgi:hypothetical protein
MLERAQWYENNIDNDRLEVVCQAFHISDTMNLPHLVLPALTKTAHSKVNIETLALLDVSRLAWVEKKVLFN